MIHAFDLIVYRERAREALEHRQAVRSPEHSGSVRLHTKKAEALEQANREALEVIMAMPSPFWHMFRDRFVSGLPYSAIATACQITEPECRDLFAYGFRDLVKSGKLHPCEGVIRLLYTEFKPYNQNTPKEGHQNRRKRQG